MKHTQNLLLQQVIQKMKVISAAQLKQAGKYFGQQRFKDMLEAGDYYSINNNDIISYPAGKSNPYIYHEKDIIIAAFKIGGIAPSCLGGQRSSIQVIFFATFIIQKGSGSSKEVIELTAQKILSTSSGVSAQSHSQPQYQIVPQMTEKLI